MFFRGRKELVCGPKAKLEVVILAVDFCWREFIKMNLPGNPVPREFDNEDQAKKSGFVTVNPPYGSGQPLQNCLPAARLKVLVRKHGRSALGGMFTIRLDGKLYAPATLDLEKGSFRDNRVLLASLCKSKRAPSNIRYVLSVRDYVWRYRPGLHLLALRLKVKKDAGETVRNPPRFMKELNEVRATFANAVCQTEGAL